MGEVAVVWVTLLISLAAAVVSALALFQSTRVARREAYELAHSLLSDLTTGEVARARNTVGVLRYGTDKGFLALDYSDVIEHYYVLEWALERITYGFEWLRPAGNEVVSSMKHQVSWHVGEIVGTLCLLHASFERDMVDQESWKRISELAELAGHTVSDPSPESVETMSRRLERLRAAGGTITAQTQAEP